MGHANQPNLDLLIKSIFNKSNSSLMRFVSCRYKDLVDHCVLIWQCNVVHVRETPDKRFNY